MDEEAWRQLTQPWKVKAPTTMNRPVGCLECRETGYLGRQGIYEVLVVSPAVQELVQPHTEAESLRKQAMKEGMRTLRLSGAARVANGETTIEEVMRVAPAHTQ